MDVLSEMAQQHGDETSIKRAKELIERANDIMIHKENNFADRISKCNSQHIIEDALEIYDYIETSAVLVKRITSDEAKDLKLKINKSADRFDECLHKFNTLCECSITK